MKRPVRAHAYAWVTVLAAALALYLVVQVAGARAPSVTPFVAAVGGAAGAAAAGIATQLAGRKVKLKAPVKLSSIALVAVLLLFASGGVRYTYGSVGDLAATLEVSPPSIAAGTPGGISGNLTLFNVGTTVVRVNPHFEVRLTNPTGGAVLRYAQGCVGRVVPQVEADLIELPPGAYLRLAFALPVVWSADDGAFAPCGAALLDSTGTYRLVGVVSSGPFNAPALVPVWAGEVFSEAKTLQVR